MCALHECHSLATVMNMRKVALCHPQVLGATNYTRWQDAHAVRACSGGGQRELQAAATARLETFAHVGIMEDLDGSILSLAAAMGLTLDGPAWNVSAHPQLQLHACILAGWSTILQR